MGGFGDLFAGLGELLGGLGEAASEAAPEIAGEAAAAAALGGRGGPPDANAVNGRYLTGGPRTLNINDR